MYTSDAREHELIKIITDILVKYGFDISVQRSSEYDILADISGKEFVIEVKISRDMNIRIDVLLKSVERIYKFADKGKCIPVIVIANLIPVALREKLKEYPELIVLDIQNLLYLVKDEEVLKNRLLSVLSFSVDNIVPVKPIELFQYNLKVPIPDKSPFEYLINKIEAWEPERKENTKYEELCTEVLQYLFSDDLTLWEVQHKSNDDLFRFDLICKIKNENNKEFWRMAESFFGTKYIVFEFKNYTGKITQKEIYTTEKYLYLKALRGIAIIISNKGTDKNAEKAIKGILREDGKLIISLTNTDLVSMLKLKAEDENSNPADYLSMKLDDILLNLEK